MAERARRPVGAWIFLGLVLGGGALAIGRAMRPEAPSRGAASASASGAASAPTELFPPEARSADPKVTPLLGGLALGDELSPGFRVVGVVLRDGRIEVNLQRGQEVGLTLWVERRKPGARPPHETEAYAITYGNVHPVDVPVPEAQQIAGVLKARVAASEAKVKPPEGL